MMLLAVLLVATQEAKPDLSVTADRHRLTVGEELTYTIKAVSGSEEPMRVQVGSTDGFEIISRTESREVSFAPVRRTSVLVLRLRALRAGSYRLGPVEARQRGHTVSVPGVSVEVTESRGAVAAAVNPRVAALLRRARPPALAGEVGLTVHLSRDTVVVGEQVDVVTAAWFPRVLRLRLRRPPTLQPPSVDGLWSYPQPAPVGIAASRRVAGSWYDLFVGHDVVFPLTPGSFTLEPASLRYSVPLALQFFSQEERLSLESDQPTLVVLPLPDDPPEGFQGAVGRDLKVGWQLRDRSGRVGDPLAIEFTVKGRGNVALWPEPAVTWPDNVRAYSERVEERHESVDGHIGGIKTFRYLVVPTEPGMLTIPALRYPYFDLGKRRYETPMVEADVVPIAPGTESTTARGLPPPLLRGDTPTLSSRLASWPPWVWLLLFGLPPAGFLIRRLVRRPRVPRRRRHVPRNLRTAELEFDRLIRIYVPDLDDHVGGALVAALGVAGIDRDTAQHVGELRDRLMAARYAPDAETAGHEPLVREVVAIVEHLATIPRATMRRRASMAGVVAVVMLVASSPEQAPSPHELYQAGALGAAAREFAARAAVEPGVVAHWYNLGAAQYRLGDDWQAAAAWQTALWLSPRNQQVKRALGLVPSPDRVSARRLLVPPVSTYEMLVLALVVWIVGWTGMMIGRRFRRRWVALLFLGGLFAVAAGATRWWQRQPRALIVSAVPLRVSPHERSPTIHPIEAGAAIWIEDRRTAWTLVRATDDRLGWVPNGTLATIGGYLTSR